MVFSSINMIISFGNVLYPEYKTKTESYLKTGAVVHDLYSMTEFGVVIAGTLFGYKPGSTGLLTPGMQCCIYDENKKRCGPNETGNLHLRKRFPFLV